MFDLLRILEALPVRNNFHSKWTSELPTPGTLELPVLPTHTQPQSHYKTHIIPCLNNVLLLKKKMNLDSD